MTLKRVNGNPVLVECPACGHYFPEKFKDDQQRWRHIADHDPEDFGLSPIGESSPKANRPLFPDPVAGGGCRVA